MKIALIALIALMSASGLYAHGISDSDKQSMIDGDYLQYVELGASHMLLGYDHLLFLFGVIFFLTKFKDIVKFITAFTLGHSITLIFATFMEISANYFLIDAVIALTVFYKGFDNIDGFKKYLKMNSPNLVILVFAFGLIHGFGLSTRLQQLPLGDEGLLLKIISFNVGVEIGQVLALTVMLFALTTWRKTASFKRFSVAANGGLMVAGILLFLMQMHGYSHEVFIDDLAFSKDSHSDAHLIMVSAKLNDAGHSDETSSKSPENDPWKDSITLSIPSGKSIEYKFHVVKGALLKYSWKTSGGKLYFDFHGEPKGDTTGSFESFEKSTESKSSGSFTAPFEGSHGWYWKNKGLETVKLTLKTQGTYKILGIR